MGWANLSRDERQAVLFWCEVSMTDATSPLIERLQKLTERLRANRYRVHGDCCNDTDNAVPCVSPVCAIEYEAECVLREAADALERAEASTAEWRRHANAN